MKPSRRPLQGFLLALLVSLIAASGCGERPDAVSPMAPGPDAVIASTVAAGTFQTTISLGPQDGGTWGPDVTFRWTSPGAERMRWALVTKEEYTWDTGLPFTTLGALIWADTLSYHVLPGGIYDTERPAWVETNRLFARFDDLPEHDSQGGPQLYCFAVRAFDEHEVEDLVVGPRFRRFRVNENLAGPRITLLSDVGGLWQAGDPVVPRTVFAGNGLRFHWTALPGPSATPPSLYSFAVDDTTHWAPLSWDLKSWPAGDDVWRPTSGSHTFWVRAVDEGGFVSTLEAPLTVFDGPRSCTERDILVVLDTDPTTMQQDGYWPPDYEAIELAMVDDWLGGTSYRVFQTNGTTVPGGPDLDCASTVLWLHSTAVGNGDASVLDRFHRLPASNLLRSWVASGGNLFVCGIQPVQALRWFERLDGQPQLQAIPVRFERTLTDPTYVPHWAATRLGIARIDQTVSSTIQPSEEPLRLAVATSAFPGEYPDLPFDPLRWPGGPVQGGFGFYDRGVQPLPGAEVAYTANDTGIPIGIRKLPHPGLHGNAFFLGLHPYFVDQDAFGDLLQAVLADFGETVTPGAHRGEVVDAGR